MDLPILNNKITYLKALTKNLIDALTEYEQELNRGHPQSWSSSNRAKYSRLRIETTKEMKKIEDYLYNRKF